MKILVLSTFDNKGGAAKAAYRFSQEYIKQDNEVCLYVNNKTTKSTFVKESRRSKLVKKLNYFLDFILGYFLSGFDKECPFTLGIFGENLNNIVKEFKPDIINVHWTWKGFISFIEICRISKKIPVIWTMHDASPFNGGLFYPEKSRFVLVNVLSSLNSFFRNFFIKKSNIHFVSPSNFLLAKFKDSYIGRKKQCLVINNGVDTSIFKPKNTEVEKSKWGLENGKKYILFGAVNFVKDPIKGGILLKKALKEIEDYLIERRICLVSYGTQDPFKYLDISHKIEKKHLGFIDKDMDMASILSCVNVVLVPSLYENYPFAVLEPLSCGTPVVAFQVGGIPELVHHLEDGYLVKGGDYKDFANGIKYCLDNKIKFSYRDSCITKKALNYIELFEDRIKTSIS